jgi:hypothetical protein
MNSIGTDVTKYFWKQRNESEKMFGAKWRTLRAISLVFTVTFLTKSQITDVIYLLLKCSIST